MLTANPKVPGSNPRFFFFCCVTDFFLAQDQNFSKIHKTDKKISFAKTIILLIDEPNCQVSSILMNPRPIYVKRSDNTLINLKKSSFARKVYNRNSYPSQP
jgi:hypothetical protein